MRSKKTVWVCCNRWCRERGASIPLGAAIALTAGEGTQATVEPHKCFGRCNVGPNVAALTDEGTLLEFHKVDSVEKTCAVLCRAGIEGVDWNAARCLEWTAQASRQSSPELATSAFSAAVRAGSDGQAAVALVGRATSRLKLAEDHAARFAKRVENALKTDIFKARLLLLLATTLPPKKSKALKKENNPEESNKTWYNYVWDFIPFVSSRKTQDDDDDDTQLRWLGLNWRRQSAKASGPTILALKAIGESLCDDATRANVDFECHMHDIEARRALDDALLAADLLPSYAQTWRVAAKASTVLGLKPDLALTFTDLANTLDQPTDSDSQDDNNNKNKPKTRVAAFA